MKRAATAIALVLPLFAASGASATDLLGDTGDPHVNEQLRQELRWSGFYAGIAGTIGMTGFDLDGNEKIDGLAAGDDWTDSVSGDGFGITGTIGYDQRLGRFIVGVFGDFTYTDDLWEVEGAEVLGESPIDANRQYDWTAGVRLGKLINPNTMIYILGGYSEMEIDAAVFDGNVGDPASSRTATFSGWTGGVGLESKVNDFLSWYVEGRYSDYGSEEVYRDVAIPDDPADDFVIEAEPSEVKAMFGLKLRLLTE